ncbi:monooxygenase FAD-binding protein [Aspergillus oryzae]|uniref:Monooxygenase FAD-binding protein n=4 Tax=Aspergillus oryzae TaxID=5062 RepID=A0A1S9DEP7_ASPOZ|nr:monooxygenase FAD-binding protein [Aspergillus oryzae]
MSELKEDYVDVLIVGAGPAGLMLANWLSRFDIKTRIVDKRGTKIFNGQADGLQCRTLEIFDSFDFAHRVWRESNHMLEIWFWNPDKDGILRRSDRIADTIPGISRFQQVVLHQGRIERFFLDSIKEHSDITVERGVLPTTFEFDEAKAADFEDYPITVTLRTLSEEEATPAQRQQHHRRADGTQSVINDGLFRSNLAADDTDDLIRVAKANNNASSVETVKAKFMVGCDGAHSWVRRQLGFKLEGDSTDYIWGVLDIVPITDFPDIRHRCAIHSANAGSVMVIPRENKLVRLYIQLQVTEHAQSGGKADRSWITPEVILQSAQRIMHPYKINYTYCDWWTAYQIGQRVGDHFSLRERVFLAGDAVHTHSPKAGQGMNVSMQDTYNLGWKIAHVVKGYSEGSILKTYQSERRRVAQDLIDFDHRLSRLFSGRPAKDGANEGVSMEEFKNAMEKGNEFASGIVVNYGSSIIVAKEGDSVEQGDGTEVAANLQRRVVSKTHLATKIDIGKRMPSFKVLNQSDARPWHLQELLKSNGRWRIIVFPGQLTQPQNMQRIQKLGDQLGSQDSFIRQYTPSDQLIDSLIEVLTVHAGPRTGVELLDLPEAFHPFDEEMGWDYWKVFVDDQSYHEGHGQAYFNYGIDPIHGAAVIVRPDQYVSWVGEVDDYEDMARFFSGFMRVQDSSKPKSRVVKLKLLQDSLSLIERDYVDHCQQMVGIIEAGIDNLQATVVRCWGDPHAASPTRPTMRHTAKKALYPFRQKTLVSVSNALDSLQLELSTALHMAQTQILNASTAAILARNLGTQTNMEQSFALYMFNQRFERFPDASAHFSQLISHFTYGDHLAEPDQGGKMPMDYLVMEDLTLNSPALLNDPISTDKVCQGVPQNMLKYGVMGEIPAGFIGTELRKKHLVHMFEECLDVSDFAWAMLCESQFALESAVESAPNCIYTNIGKGEYTTGDIHLALAAAIRNNTLDSVQLLFRVDVPLPRWMFYGQSSIDMQVLLIAEITKRRAELRDVAESVLTINDLARFQLTKGQLLDSNAASMCNLLGERGIAVHKRLTIDEEHSILGDMPYLSMMKALYQAGFRDKSSLAPPQPVYPVANLQRAMWLMDMDLSLKVSKDGFSTVLELCSSITYSFSSMVRQPGPWTSLTCKHACQVVTGLFQALNKEERQFWLGCLASKETTAAHVPALQGKDDVR